MVRRDRAGEARLQPYSEPQCLGVSVLLRPDAADEHGWATSLCFVGSSGGIPSEAALI